ncbi:MAG: DUF3997 domain-containing protein [Ignavibacteria bacterium]|nr:DUF3997 domain-containing protein [Ignavibacteria bacterium]
MLKIKIVSCFLFIIYFTGCSDYTVELSNGYIFVSESKVNQKIVKKGYFEKEKYIPCTVIAFNYNDDFIIAAQINNPDGVKRVLINDPVFFWIIYHKGSQFIGPVSIDEYLKQRKELHIPDDLKLDLKL